MGCRVHVVARQAEYGSCGFNWKDDQFRTLLDDLGCNTSGREDSTEFDCWLPDYKQAVKAVAIFVNKKNNPKLEAELDQILEENGITREDLSDDIECAGDSSIDRGREVLTTMVSMLVTRDKTSDYIEFASF